MQLSPRAAPPRARRGRRGSPSRVGRCAGWGGAAAGLEAAPRRLAGCPARLRPGRAGPGRGGRVVGRACPPCARCASSTSCGVRSVFRPRFRREVRRFTSDLERGPDGAQGARTDAGGRGEAGARPPRVEPALQPRDQRSRLVAKVPDAVRVVHRCGFRVTAITASTETLV